MSFWEKFTRLCKILIVKCVTTQQTPEELAQKANEAAEKIDRETKWRLLGWQRKYEQKSKDLAAKLIELDSLDAERKKYAVLARQGDKLAEVKARATDAKIQLLQGLIRDAQIALEATGGPKEMEANAFVQVSKARLDAARANGYLEQIEEGEEFQIMSQLAEQISSGSKTPAIALNIEELQRRAAKVNQRVTRDLDRGRARTETQTDSSALDRTFGPMSPELAELLAAEPETTIKDEERRRRLGDEESTQSRQK
jgi:hypothetical protein